MHLVGSYTYCRMMHGAYNVKFEVDKLCVCVCVCVLKESAVGVKGS